MKPKSKSSYKSKLKADKKAKPKKSAGMKADGVTLNKDAWTNHIVSAVWSDNVELLKFLMKEQRWSALDVNVAAVFDGQMQSEPVNFLTLAARAGAARCLEHLCCAATSSENVNCLTQMFKYLFSCYESGACDKTKIESLILAAKEGAAKGCEGPVPSMYFFVDLKFPNATRFALTCMADRPCGAVASTPELRAHIENKQKVFEAIARGDLDGIAIHLRQTLANLKKLGRNQICEAEIVRFMQMAATCKRPESLVAAFNTVREMRSGANWNGAVLGMMLNGLEQLMPTVGMARLDWLDDVVKKCAALAVIEDKGLAKTILDNASAFFTYVDEPAKAGALVGFAEAERRELESHTEMKNVIDRVSTAVRI
jgi:hypothetical protein